MTAMMGKSQIRFLKPNSGTATSGMNTCIMWDAACIQPGDVLNVDFRKHDGQIYLFHGALDAQ